MGRPSVRERRRKEIARAFVRVLASHGQAGASISAVAAEAGVAPGLVHHHFTDKQDLYAAVIDVLLADFRRRTDAIRAGEGSSASDAYADGALGLGANADVIAARAWVGVFAEALSDPVLFQKLRRLIDGEVALIERNAGGTLRTGDASAVLSFILGALVFGAFAPRKVAGFAAPSLRRFIASLSVAER